jgi:hypothetical protein
MKNKSVTIFEELRPNIEIKILKKIKEIHPVAKHIVANLADLNFIHFVRLSTEHLQASNEVTKGRIKKPITKTNHPTAIGVDLILDITHKDIQFYEITSAIKGCGGKMVDSVLKALPEGWNGVVVMDWSNGFWDKMTEKHKNLYIL